MKVCPDIICFPESPESYPDRWVLMNVFTRDCLGIAPEVLEFLAEPTNAKKQTFRIWDIWRFSHADGLLADPSRFRRNAATWGEPLKLSGEALWKLLFEKSFLIDDSENYRKRFESKKSLLDKENIGNYHEELGQHLFTVERRDPTHWWLDQKFASGANAFREDNLYASVQYEFLNQWLPKKITAGQSILDIGCGPGVISKIMADLGAKVLGIDPNLDYVKLANKSPRGASFEHRKMESPKELEEFPEQSFDKIFMSDALLFYFVPYQKNKIPSIELLVRQIKRLLKPGGSFLSLEPHPVFYLLPWLGEETRPFSILTEYFEAKWRINPPLSKLTKAFLREGFAITDLEEPISCKEKYKVGKRATRFAEKFPLWLALEMRNASF
jgi:SAM-dependent methyltransferase